MFYSNRHPRVGLQSNCKLPFSTWLHLVDSLLQWNQSYKTLTINASIYFHFMYLVLLEEEEKQQQLITKENVDIGHHSYMEACQLLGTAPIRKVREQLTENEICLQHTGLNTKDVIALTYALLVSGPRTIQIERDLPAAYRPQHQGRHSSDVRFAGKWSENNSQRTRSVCSIPAGLNTMEVIALTYALLVSGLVTTHRERDLPAAYWRQHQGRHSSDVRFAGKCSENNTRRTRSACSILASTPMTS